MKVYDSLIQLRIKMRPTKFTAAEFGYVKRTYDLIIANSNNNIE
jgi:hypothetical protein